MDTSPKKPAVYTEDEEEESDRMVIEDAVVEEPVENEPVVEEQPKQTANVSEESTNTEEAPKPMRGYQRFFFCCTHHFLFFLSPKKAYCLVSKTKNSLSWADAEKLHRC